MKLNTDLRSDSGSAILELVGFGVLLQIPILMFATLVIQTQQQNFAAEAIARHGLRAHVLWPNRDSTARVIDEIASDFGLSKNEYSWRINCTPNPSCLESQSVVEIQVRLGSVIASSSQRL